MVYVTNVEVTISGVVDGRRYASDIEVTMALKTATRIATEIPAIEACVGPVPGFIQPQTLQNDGKEHHTE